MKYNEKKEQGFSLLEVMIALAVVSFLSFTVLQLVFTNLQATKSFEITTSLDNLVMEVNMALKDPAICQSNIPNFSTKSLPSPLEGGIIDIKQITLPSVTVPLVSSNAPLVNQPSTKINLHIDSIKPISTVAYLANVSFGLDKGQGALGARNIVRRLPMSLTLTVAGGPITGCNTFGPSGGGTAGLTPAGVCALLGRTFDPTTNKCSGSEPSTAGCAGQATLCEGIAMQVPPLSEGGTFKSSWKSLQSISGAHCDYSVTCKNAAWTAVKCQCK